MIELNEQKQKEIVAHFKSLIDERKQANKELIEDKLPEYWDRYLGTYSSKKNKSFPWEEVQTCIFHSVLLQRQLLKADL